MIFYFSATGNSKYVAEQIAAANGDRLVGVGKAVKTKALSYEVGPGEDIGIVCPVYFWGIPDIVHNFLKSVKLSGKGQDRYVYCVLTYGTVTGGASSMIMTDLRQNFGLTLSAVFAVHTVDTYLPIFDVKDTGKNEKVLEKARADAADVAEKVRDRTRGDFNYDRGAWALLWPVAQIIYDKKRKTEKFAVSDACISCGLCERQCPENVIKLRDGKPCWIKPSCSICFGCIHRCPVNAISFAGKTQGKGQYYCPDTEPDL